MPIEARKMANNWLLSNFQRRLPFSTISGIKLLFGNNFDEKKYAKQVSTVVPFWYFQSLQGILQKFLHWAFDCIFKEFFQSRGNCIKIEPTFDFRSIFETLFVNLNHSHTVLIENSINFQLFQLRCAKTPDRMLQVQCDPLPHRPQMFSDLEHKIWAERKVLIWFFKELNITERTCEEIYLERVCRSTWKISIRIRKGESIK